MEDEDCIDIRIRAFENLENFIPMNAEILSFGAVVGESASTEVTVLGSFARVSKPVTASLQEPDCINLAP